MHLHRGRKCPYDVIVMFTQSKLDIFILQKPFMAFKVKLKITVKTKELTLLFTKACMLFQVCSSVTYSKSFPKASNNDPLH